jgi:hypothetical protein
MSPKTLCALLLGLVAAGVLAAPIRGSIVPRMSLEELVSEADSIVDGVVESVESRWEDRMIFSYVTIRIDDPLKGRRSRTAVVRQVGGRIGNRILDVPGMPVFHDRDRVVVFLKDTGNGTFHVVGMAQGRYLVRDDRAVANLTAADFVDPAAGIRGVSTTVAFGVEALKARIRELVR